MIAIAIAFKTSKTYHNFTEMEKWNLKFYKKLLNTFGLPGKVNAVGIHIQCEFEGTTDGKKHVHKTLSYTKTNFLISLFVVDH